MNILLIEDEPNVASFIRRGLQEQSCTVDLAFDGQAGLQKARQNLYDLILLDVVLPKLNGLELCRLIREQSQVPILMLTAMGTTDDIVNGLDFGADDYLTKPFKFKELMARIRAVVRRKNDLFVQSAFSLADLHVDFKSKEVSRGGQKIHLTAREFYLLEYFIQHKGQLVTRSEIAERVWENAFDSGSNIVDVYVNYLRNKIDRDFSPKLIHTVYGMGYIFKEAD